MSNWKSRDGNRGSYNNNRDRGNYRDQRESEPQRFPNSGAIFPNSNRRSDNSPDWTGHITISDDVLDYILREAENGEEVKLDLSGWSRMTRDNSTMTSLKINIPYSVRMEETGNPTYRAQPRPPRRDTRQQTPQPQRRGSSYAEQSQSGRGNYDERSPPPQDDFPDFLRDDDDPLPR